MAKHRKMRPAVAVVVAEDPPHLVVLVFQEVLEIQDRQEIQDLQQY
jgi:hypothetical protein